MRGAKMSPNATKVLSRIEALRGAAKAGVLSSEEAGAADPSRWPHGWPQSGDRNSPRKGEWIEIF